MLVKQVSAFIENKTGRLSELADTLAAQHIDISALSLADTAEYGIVRMILSDPERAVEALRASGVVCKVTTALAVAIDDTPGGFARALRLLTDRGTEIKYMYACVGHTPGKALMILSVDDPQAAERLLDETDAGKINPKEIYRI